MISIINIGGNVGSIQNMLKKLKLESMITDDPSIIKSSDHIILPGVGSFDSGMTRLTDFRGISSILSKKVRNDKTPILGICLGMQLFTKKSEEGLLNGLGYIDATTVKFNTRARLPHMGWNTLKHEQHPLFSDMPPDERFYFIHSYHVSCNEQDVISTTHYHYEFPSAIQHENIYGVQFHPEKSHRYGMKLLYNFSRL